MRSNKAKASRLSCQESTDPCQAALSLNPEISGTTGGTNVKGFYGAPVIDFPRQTPFVRNPSVVDCTSGRGSKIQVIQLEHHGCWLAPVCRQYSNVLTSDFHRRAFRLPGYVLRAQAWIQMLPPSLSSYHALA